MKAFYLLSLLGATLLAPPSLFAMDLPENKTNQSKGPPVHAEKFFLDKSENILPEKVLSAPATVFSSQTGTHLVSAGELENWVDSPYGQVEDSIWAKIGNSVFKIERENYNPALLKKYPLTPVCFTWNLRKNAFCGSLLRHSFVIKKESSIGIMFALAKMDKISESIRQSIRQGFIPNPNVHEELAKYAAEIYTLDQNR